MCIDTIVNESLRAFAPATAIVDQKFSMTPWQLRMAIGML